MSKGNKTCGVIGFFVGIGLLCLSFLVIFNAVLLNPEILPQFADTVYPQERRVGYTIIIFLILVMVFIGAGVTGYGRGLLTSS